MLLVIGTMFSLGMIVFSNKIATLIGASDTRLAIIMVAPTMLFICLSSCLRGYFQGYQRMLPTAISQLLEAAGKLIFGLLFAHIAKDNLEGSPLCSVYT